MTKDKSQCAQIRLLLPKEWVAELDNLAATRYLTRLGLIRFLLRSKMNEELSTLAEHFKATEQNKHTHQQIKQTLQDREW